MMPPYTIDGELNHTARKHDYINLVGLFFTRGLQLRRALTHTCRIPL